MSEPIKFTGVDADKWIRIKKAVQDKTGISIQTDAGVDEARGIRLGWAYMVVAEELSITLIKRSIWDPSEQEIDTDIEKWIGGA